MEEPSRTRTLTPKQVAVRCRLNPAVVFRAIRSGALAATGNGRRGWRVTEGDLAAWTERLHSDSRNTARRRRSQFRRTRPSRP